jgi:hypothetical protein
LAVFSHLLSISEISGYQRAMKIRKTALKLEGSSTVNTTDAAGPAVVNEDDVISFTPSGATGSAAGHFRVRIVS